MINMNRIIADLQITAVLGPFCSGSTLAALPYLEEANFAMISSGATRPGLHNFGPTVFNRVILDDSKNQDLEALLQSPPVQKFLGKFSSYAGLTLIDMDLMWVFYAFTYDAAFVLLNAIEKVL